MQRLLVLVILMSAAGAAASEPICPPGYKTRTAAQVLVDHRAALAVGDVNTDVTCNYATDAVVIFDQGVNRGREAIRMSLQGFVNFFGGIMPIVTSEVAVTVLNSNTELVRLLFSVEVPCVSVPDGADTYVIKNGQIHGQTSHAFPVFTCGPPPF